MDRATLGTSVSPELLAAADAAITEHQRRLLEHCADLSGRVEALERQNQALQASADGLREQFGGAARKIGRMDGDLREARAETTAARREVELAQLQRDVHKTDAERLLRGLELYREAWKPRAMDEGAAAVVRWEGEEGHRYPVKAPR